MVADVAGEALFENIKLKWKKCSNRELRTTSKTSPITWESQYGRQDNALSKGFKIKVWPKHFFVVRAWSIVVNKSKRSGEGGVGPLNTLL